MGHQICMASTFTYWNTLLARIVRFLCLTFYKSATLFPMTTDLCCISTIYETLLLLVMFAIFCLLHCSHPADWGVGLTVVLLIIPLKDSFKGIQRVLG